MNLADLVGAAIGSLNAAGVPFMVTGSLASSFYGAPRATNDLDVVIDPDPLALDRLVDALHARGFHVDAEAARVALVEQSQFNAIAPDAWKIDFIVRKDRAFSKEEFSRRRGADLLGTEGFIASPEDMIVAKLEWAAATDSDRQLRDVASMLDVDFEALDRAYIEHWVDVLGLRTAWAAIEEESERR